MMEMDRLMPILQKLRLDRDDQDSWRQLKELLWPYLASLIGHRAGEEVPKEDHEDISVEVFVCIVAAWPWATTTCAVRFLGFVSQLVNHRIVDHVRHLNTQHAHLPVERWQTIDEGVAFLVAGTSESDVRQLLKELVEEIQKDARDKLDQQILAVSPQCKNQNEIAAQLGVAASTVWRRLKELERAWFSRRAMEGRERKTS